MQRRGNLKAIVRAIAVMSAVMIIISGVTFAALQSQQAVLSGNTITSASADLKISLNGITYDSTMPGFNFGDVIPGGPLVPAAGYSFYLKNSGSIGTTLKVSINGTPSNLSGVDLTKVSAVFTRVPGGTPQTFTLAALVAANASGGLALTDTLAANSVLNFKVQVSMAVDAFSGQGVTLGNINFVFMGTAVTP